MKLGNKQINKISISFVQYEKSVKRTFRIKFCLFRKKKKYKKKLFKKFGYKV